MYSYLLDIFSSGDIFPSANIFPSVDKIQDDIFSELGADKFAHQVKEEEKQAVK